MFQLSTWTWLQGLYILDQAVEDSEQNLSLILMDSVETSDLDASFEESDTATIAPLVSSGFLHLVSTISDSSKPKLAHCIKCHMLWWETRVVLFAFVIGV